MAGVTSNERIEANALKSALTRAWRSVALVAIGGFAFGALDLLGQGALKGSWNYAANSISVWLAAAFVAGSFIPSRRWSAVAGMGALLAALVGYYVVAPHFVAAGPINGLAIFWFATAIVGGPIFGFAGHAWRHESFWPRIVAAALIGGVFVAEGARLTHIVPPEYISAGWGEIMLGALLPLLLGRSIRERLLGLLALPFAALLGVIGFALIDAITGAVF